MRKKWITTKEAQEAYSISRRQLYVLAEDGEIIMSGKPRCTRRVSVESIEEYLKRNVVRTNKKVAANG